MIETYFCQNFEGQHLVVVMSMQMDAEFKKEQIGTLFVWLGALEGGFGG